MSHIALARKWRPQTFSKLVGQEPVIKALINSLQQQRLHHAYLFTGTRGVGKTSIARLIAKALNCEQGISSEPCLTCDACTSIEQGRFFDLIEIDGASKTRVEDTRELLENIQYAPTHGRFKIYLIDEVHMLSQHSFNALLKTLEEPPEHVKFLLATTDPQKLPITVLSRCLQFHLRPLTESTIAQQLQYILNEEQFTWDADAALILAKAAQGSMRDALSLLDQCIAHSHGNHILAQDVRSILGHTQQDYAQLLLKALIENKPNQLIEYSRQIMAEGGNFRHVLETLLEHLHAISIQQVLKTNNPLLTPSAEILALSKNISPEDTQLFYHITLKGLEELELAPMALMAFEMTLLKMYAFKPVAQVSLNELQTKVHPSNQTIAHEISPASQAISENIIESRPEVQSLSELLPNDLPTKSANLSKKQKNTDNKASVVEPIENNQPSISNHDAIASWETILPHLKLTGLALSAAENAELVGIKQGSIQLNVDPKHESLFTSSVIKRIEQALTNHYQHTVKLTIIAKNLVTESPAQKKQGVQKQKMEQAEKALREDPMVQRLQQTFSAEIVPNSIVSVPDES